MPPLQVPPIAFLGACERAAQVPDGLPQLAKWNLIGLKSVVPSHVFPLSLSGWYLGFALFSPAHADSFDIVFRDERGLEQGSFRIDLTAVDGDGVSEEAGFARSTPSIPTSWVVSFTPGAAVPGFVPRPGRYTFNLRAAGQETPIGSLAFVLVEPESLTPDRIAAIKSDPHAAKAVRAQLGCAKCPTKLGMFATLDRPTSPESEGYVWYSELPERFTCSCGLVNVELDIARRNFHALLGARIPLTGGLSFLRLYEQGILDAVTRDLRRLLDGMPREEEIQVFFAANPILLHEFSAERTFPKAPVLTKYKTDFAIVNYRRELILVELEKPSTRLLTARGGVASDLQHAFDQVHSWLQVFDEHRAAALECLGLNTRDVGSVRGVVIAGRDLGSDAEHLRKLKARDFGRVRLLTYDDVLTSVIEVGRALQD